MKRVSFLFLLVVPIATRAAEHDHAEHTQAAPAAADHSAHIPASPPTALPTGADPAASQPSMSDAAHEALMAEHGGSLNFLVLGERLEQSDADTRVWELQAWLGYDYDKLWLKTEGEYDTDAGATAHSEVQLLYSRALAPYWDLQAGLRRDDAGSETRTYGVIGFMGLAPNWFEVDAAAFVSEHGDLSARLEAEYELRFTQKLLLQPRLELNYSFADDLDMRIGEGTSEASFGLRLRYEARREFAPYLGVEWVRSYGKTATLMRATGTAREELRVLAGLRVWY